MPLSDVVYHSALRVLRLASPALERGESKLARGLRGRQGTVERLVGWARGHRDAGRPLLWFHAPSVGEGLQARAVLDAARGENPALQTVFTHFSPSAEPLARTIGADVADYLPWDLPSDARALLRALRPTVLAFTKTEVWPTFSREAARQGVPLVLVAGTLPAGSSRLAPLARSLLRPAFSRLTAVYAVSGEDGERFARLGVPPERVTVTGDPGIDSAAERAAGIDPDAPHLRVFGRPAFRVVAGSTWPPDEAALLSACQLLRERVPGFQLVLAPHEPGPARLAALLGRLGARGWRAASLAEVEAAGSAEGWDAVVVDRVGVLAHLYTVGDVSYVGGGFHDKGLHSVLEPAAAATPVCFGPRHRNAPAAGELVRSGAARVVSDARALGEQLARWARDDDDRVAAGRAASSYIQSHRGAALTSARLLLARMRG